MNDNAKDLAAALRDYAKTVPNLEAKMTEAERKKIEKEIQGLTAKLNWEHLDESLKENYRARITYLLGQLKVNN